MKNIIIKAAKEGGITLKQYFKKTQNIRYKEKGRLNTVLTDADLASEKKIFSILKNKFPDFNILSEEAGTEQRNSPYTWVIDPMDGTQNFVLGLPEFGVAIALAKEKEIIISAIYFPMLDEFYYAEKGKGAFLNGNKIHVSTIKKFEDATLSLNDKRTKVNINPQIFLDCQRFFKTACAILFPSFLASGRCDASIVSIYPWDVAATSLLITEAGGKITDIDGEAFDYTTGNLVATNGLIHNKLLQYIKKK